MDKSLQIKLTRQVIDQIKADEEINFQASPTRAIEKVIRLALDAGWEAYRDRSVVADPTPDGPYAAHLEERLRRSKDRTERYRLQAELEDLADGHWDGPRTDDPPNDWQG